MPTDLIASLKELSARDLEAMLHQREAEDKALRVLLRAARARERAERQLHRQTEGRNV